MKHVNKTHQQGFTIVELMIATAVLSTILILSTIMMISIGNLLYKGINQARVQDGVRTITDAVAQDLKISNDVVSGTGTANIGSVTVNLGAVCIGGNVRYSFITGYKIGAAGSRDADGTTPQVPHVLWRDSDQYTALLAVPTIPTQTCIPVNLTSAALNNGASGDTGAVEMISANSRLTIFCISSDTVCGSTPTSPFNITVGEAYGDIDLLTGTMGRDVLCKNGHGDQFCSTSTLTTTVVQRLTGGS